MSLESISTGSPILDGIIITISCVILIGVPSTLYKFRKKLKQKFYGVNITQRKVFDGKKLENKSDTAKTFNEKYGNTREVLQNKILLSFPKPTRRNRQGAIADATIAEKLGISFPEIGRHCELMKEDGLLIKNSPTTKGGTLYRLSSKGVKIVEKKEILTLEQRHWNAFVNEKANEYFDELINFVEKLEKNAPLDWLNNRHYYLEQLYGQIGNRARIEKRTIYEPLLIHIDGVRRAFLQGVYQDFPKLNLQNFKRTNLDLVIDTIKDYQKRLGDFLH